MNLLNKLIILFLLAGSAWAVDRERIQGQCQQGNKTVLVAGGLNTSTTTPVMRSYPSCTVTVYLTGTTNLATIYADNIGTAKGNPFTADAVGYWYWYANDGQYDVKLSGGTIPSPFTLGDYQPFSRKFLQTGSGAVERTIKSKLTDIVNVLDFGAVCDWNGSSGTNDASAIQAAISSLASGGTVQFPNGKYCYIGSTTLSIVQPTWLVGGSTGAVENAGFTPGTGGSRIYGTGNPMILINASQSGLANIGVYQSSIVSSTVGLQIGDGSILLETVNLNNVIFNGAGAMALGLDTEVGTAIRVHALLDSSFQIRVRDWNKGVVFVPHGNFSPPTTNGWSDTIDINHSAFTHCNLALENTTDGSYPGVTTLSISGETRFVTNQQGIYYNGVTITGIAPSLNIHNAYFEGGDFTGLGGTIFNARMAFGSLQSDGTFWSRDAGNSMSASVLIDAANFRPHFSSGDLWNEGITHNGSGTYFIYDELLPPMSSNSLNGTGRYIYKNYSYAGNTEYQEAVKNPYVGGANGLCGALSTCDLRTFQWPVINARGRLDVTGVSTDNTAEGGNGRVWMLENCFGTVTIVGNAVHQVSGTACFNASFIDVGEFGDRIVINGDQCKITAVADSTHLTAGSCYSGNSIPALTNWPFTIQTNKFLYYGLDAALSTQGGFYMQGLIEGDTILPIFLQPRGGAGRVIIGKATDDGITTAQVVAAPSNGLSIAYDGGIKSTGVTFATLSGIENKSQVFCTNCNIVPATPYTCTTGGSGAWAFKNNGTWKCPF